MRLVCQGLEKVACLPCRACGMTCHAVCDVLSSPFFLYLAVALGFNLPPIVFAFQARAQWDAAGGGDDEGGGGGDDACGEGTRWLIVNSMLCVANIAAAIYIVWTIQNSREEAVLSNYVEMDGVKSTKENSMKRVTHVLCYDPWVALYIVVGVMFVIWQSMGIGKSVAMGDACDGLRPKLFNSILCGYLFLSLMAASFLISVCCMKAQNILPK